MITWILEQGVFEDRHQRLIDAVVGAGHRFISWDDGMWDGTRLPDLSGAVLFHGSLGNADRMAHEAFWSPGAFCKTAAFACSSWYAGARPHLLQETWQVLRADRLAEDPSLIAFPHSGEIFVRPDSPLKPFSGRVISVNDLSLEAMDHGFYYEDPALPVVIAPVVPIGEEWRFVVVDGKVVAGSGYDAEGRYGGTPLKPGECPWGYAQEVARDLAPPESVYVLDICKSGTRLRLIELNPFSGADLYGCDRGAIVGAISELLSS